MNTRRDFLKLGGLASVGFGVTLSLRPLCAAVSKTGGSQPAGTPAAAYDPLAHQWRMVIDIEKCIGCGLCAKACKKENKVPPEPYYYRTWVERYVIKTAAPGGSDLRGATLVDSPNGGMDGFPPSPVPVAQVLKSFFVPKLCNECADSPCSKACPVGAAFESPDGVALVDKNYCIGCGFCIQSCPFGCRFLNPITRCADKCTLCYHRITKGLRPACVEVCPTGARIFGDLKSPAPDNPVRSFVKEKKVQVLKPHLGTNPRVYYAGLDKEVR
jgi:Fe-S-cluster-containing dehydrogenase component